ncbi:hypothetical protein [Neobacillus sp. Marseille-QA0830]
MNKFLNWYERVFEELKKDQSYDRMESYYHCIEYLNDSLIFEKSIGKKHPEIQLYDSEHGKE